MSFYNKELAAKIDAYISENKEQILSDLMNLVRIPSVQSAPLPGAPFGKACSDMLYETATLFEKNGFPSTVKADNGYALSLFENTSDKTIGLFSHGDVVPVDGEWIMCPPFEPVISGEHMFGRGCNDDKSGIIEALYAAKIIRDLKLPLKSNLLMYTGSNEESGMADIVSYVENEKMPDASIVPDGSYPCYSGEKSSIRFEVTSKKPFESIKEFVGGKAFNVILGEVKVTLPYCADVYNRLSEKALNNDRFVITSSSDAIKITAKGISTHSAAPQGSLNACLPVTELLSECNAVTESDMKILSDVKAFLADNYGKAFDIEHNDEFFGKLTCGNGIVKMTDDLRFSMIFDVRAGCSIDINDLAEKIKETTPSDWDVTIKSLSQGYVIDENSKFIKALERTYQDISGIKDAKCTPTSGGTYSRKLKNAFSIGTVAYYKEKAKPDLPEGHGGYHQMDERLCIDGLLESIKILVFMIMEFDILLH